MNAGSTTTHRTHPGSTEGDGRAETQGTQESPDTQRRPEAPASQQLTPDRPPQTPEAPRERTDAKVESSDDKLKRPRGFAAMDRKLVSEIARKGGKAAHSAGTAHEFTSAEAREAGRKGGRATHAKRRSGDEESDPPETASDADARGSAGEAGERER